LAFTVTSALLAACGAAPSADELVDPAVVETDGELRCGSVPSSDAPPDVDVLPAQLDFGLVSRLAPSRRTMRVSSVGWSDLVVCGLEVEPEAQSAFRVVDVPPLPVTLAAGDVLPLDLEFSPSSEGPIETRLVIRTNDPDEPEIAVRLIAEDGQEDFGCDYAVEPARVDFGVAPVGTSVRRTVSVENRHAHQPCLLAAFDLGPDSSIFTLDSDVSPQLIESGEAFELDLIFAPEAPGAVSCTAEYGISNPNRPWGEVELLGQGL
jgi:hypothetical protein